MDKFLILANDGKDIDLALSKKITEYLSKKGATS